MTSEELKLYEDTILGMLERSGTSLASLDSDRSLLFLLSTIIPGYAFAILWNMKGGQYQRACTTVTEDDYKSNHREIESAFSRALGGKPDRGRDVLRIKPVIEKPLSCKVDEFELKTTFGASIKANCLILLPLGKRKVLAEFYCDRTISAEDLNRIHQIAENIFTCLESRLIQIYQVLRSADGVQDFREIVGEQRLFRQILRDMKTWFGEDFRTVNIFKFDPRDRLLYHIETTHLLVDDQALEAFEPAAEISDPKIVEYIKSNIDAFGWPKGIERNELRAVLESLRDKKAWKRKALADGARLLKALLTAIPQEPGTGVAGETALTRIPQLGLNTSDSRWETRTPAYRGTYFAAMLSIEQIFGIGTSGNKMAAVPLMESGQLWGVMFFVKKSPYTSLRLLSLWEKAQQLSSVLSLFRSFQFQNAIVKGARLYPLKTVSKLALENIHLALNPIAAVHWHFHRKAMGADKVEYWHFDSETGRFSEGGTEVGTQGYFKSARIRTQMHRKIEKGKIEILEFSSELDERETGLPKELDLPHREMIRSVIMIPTPPYDLIAVYSDEEVRTVAPSIHLFEDRFSCLWDIDSIRGNSSVATEFVAQSKVMKNLLEQLEKAAQTPFPILLRGERGTGKELIATLIHEQSNRSAKLRTINVSTLSEELAASELFGYTKDSHSRAKTNRAGEFEKADGSSIFLDEIGDLKPDIQAKLLRAIQFGEVRPIMGEAKTVDVRVIAATNRDLEAKIKDGTFRDDLFDRFIIKLTIPALRDRSDDIPPLARHFARLRKLEITAETVAALWNYDWPGNVREIEHLFANLSWQHPNAMITLNELDPSFRNGSKAEIWAKNVNRYLGREDAEDGRSGWALFSNSTYDIDYDPRDDWTRVTLAAFQKLKTRLKPQSYCSIGCGAGLDALIALNQWDLEAITLSDINEEVLAIAQENVYLNAPSAIDVYTSEGSLFDNCGDRKFDLLYENLPNLSWQDAVNPNGRDYATFHTLKHGLSSAADEWLLLTHEHFLNEARKHLNAGGYVVCCIGARVPWPAVQGLFESQGYVPELIHFDIKKQQQVDEVVAGYARVERDRAPFMFLDLTKTRELISQTQDSATADELRKLVMQSEAFEGVRLTASAALKEHEKGPKGKTIGHGVYVVAGSLKK